MLYTYSITKTLKFKVIVNFLIILLMKIPEIVEVIFAVPSIFQLIHLNAFVLLVPEI